MATKKDTTTITATGMRRCIGSATFGIEAHEAPVDDFPRQPSQKDGLGRMCRPHWTEYTRALRKASVARKAAEPGEPDPAPEAPAHEHTLAASMVGEGEPIEPPAPRRSRRAKATPEQEAVTTAIREILAG